MKGNDYIPVISHLQNLQSEAARRTQVGRLYYAAYTDVRHLCSEHFGYREDPKKNGHDELRKFVRETVNDEPLANLMHDLHELRKLADYRVIQTFTSQRVVEAKRKAKEISERVHRDHQGRSFYP